MRVYIIADMVGSCGIWREKQCQVGSMEWRKARKQFTLDVNSAIEGLQRLGYDDIIIKDVHGTGTNLRPEILIPKARYEPGIFLHPVPILGKVRWASCALLLGFHAKAGTEDAFCPHTLKDSIADLRINGSSVGEAILFSAALAELGIPVTFVSGDSKAIDEVRQKMPGVETLAIAKDRQSNLDLKEGSTGTIRKRNEIRAIVEKSCRSPVPLKTKFQFTKPVHFEVEFKSVEFANYHNSWGLRQSENTVSWESKEFLTGFEQLVNLIYVPRPLARVANQMFKFTNAFNRVLHGVF